MRQTLRTRAQRAARTRKLKERAQKAAQTKTSKARAQNGVRTNNSRARPPKALNKRQAHTPRQKVRHRVNADPRVFVVRDGGTLDTGCDVEPLTRGDVYFLSRHAFKDVASVLSLEEEVEPVSWELTEAYRNFREGIVAAWGKWKNNNDHASERTKRSPSRTKVSPRRSPENWPEEPERKDIVRFVNGLTFKEFASLRRRLNAWLKAEPDYDWEDDFVVAASGQEATLRFFSDEVDQDIRNTIGVRIIEGEFPGSTYYAAELTVDADEANRRASANDLTSFGRDYLLIG